MNVQLCKYVVPQRNDVFPPLFHGAGTGNRPIDPGFSSWNGRTHTFAHFLILQLHISIIGALELG